MKILIAEDDDNSRVLLEVLLQNIGIEVVSFNNGKDALQYLESESVNAIISDILMPEMDGFDFCRAVKQSATHKEIPFIFYTATYTAAEDEQFARSLGANHFAVKPLPPEDFLEMLALVIDTHDITPANSHKNDQPNMQLLAGDSTEEAITNTHLTRVKAKLDKKIIELETERKKLRESEQRFRDFAESSGDWLWETGADLALKIISSVEFKFRPCSLVELAEHCYNPNSQDLLSAVERKKRFADFVIEYRSKNEPVMYLRLSGKPIFDIEGEFAGYRGVGSNVTDTVMLAERVRFLASHDELTGLPNRNTLQMHLKYTLTRAERGANQVAVMFIDLDNFKVINDTLGHAAGDILLASVGERIATRARAADMLGRLGGDEFLMILENATPQDAHAVATELTQMFAKPFDVAGQRVFSAASIGISIYPNDADTAEAMINAADLAMYRAKDNGKNKFEFYTAEMSDAMHAWLAIETGLKTAIETNQLFLKYQPQIDIASGQIIGVEALVRWQHPSRGLLSPDLFIPIAEQSSLIVLLGEWVINQVFKQLQAWQIAKVALSRVSMNISAKHLRSEHFITHLEQAISRYGDLQSAICVEITEHAMLEDLLQVQTNMQYLQTRGFQISLDDFGMGHSSLVYLRRYAVHEIKIDRSFVATIDEDSTENVIVKAIIALAQALKIDIIAEGVETLQQSEVLAGYGCKYAQGYFYSAAVDADAIESMCNQVSLVEYQTEH